MTLPGVHISKIEGSARTVNTGAKLPVVIGPCDGSGISTGSLYVVGSSDSLFGSAGFGYGAGPRLVGKVLDAVEGSCVYIPCAASITTSNTLSGTLTSGVGERTATLSGLSVPNNFYDFKLRILESGATLTGLKIDYTLNGLDYTQPQVVSGSTNAANVTITNTGCVVTLSGTFFKDDIFSGFLKPNTMNATDLTNALTVLKDNINLIGGNPSCVLIANEPITNSNGLDIATQLNTDCTRLEGYDIRTQYMIHGRQRPTSTTSTQKSLDAASFINTFFGYVNSTGNIISIGHNFGFVSSPSGENIPGCPRAYEPLIYIDGPQAAKVDISTNVAGQGALPGLTMTKTWTLQSPAYDERLDGELYSSSTNRFLSHMTRNNAQGLYLVKAWTRSASQSTFNTWHRGRVANYACDILQKALNAYQNTDINVLDDGTNRGDPIDLANIELDINNQLRTALIDPINKDSGKKAYCSAIGFTVDREHDMSDNTLYGTCSIVPKADIEQINVTVAFNRSTGTASIVRE